MIRYKTLKERVQRGAEWLDSVAPGWEDRINTETLRLMSPYSCICGQVFGEFRHAINMLVDASLLLNTEHARDIAYRNTIQFGFALEDHHSNSKYDELQEIWVDLLKERASRPTEESIV